MKKYKLVKCYPGSAKLGTIALLKTNCEPHCFLLDDPFHQPLPTKQVLNNPEYWEEIVEKDYEIMSLMYHDRLYDKVDKTDSNWKYISKEKGHCLLSQAGLNICGIITIHSIKRLSDGEIFTVGDIDNFGKITGFVIRENKIVSQYYRIGDWQWLSSIQHIKKPLFTTEDGVDIFEGDKYFQIGIKFNNIECEAYDENNFAESLIIFSTKEKAEEYILMNKPCLSIEEVMNISYNPAESYTSSSRKLKELVKSKL
jgi:hypothetical protein